MTKTAECNLIIGMDRNGKLIRAARSFAPGDLIHELSGEYFQTRNKYTIEIDGRHLVDPIAKFINHSFKPNIVINGYRITALLVIEAGDELTFDYTTTESEFSHPFIDHESGEWVGRNPLESAS